jgi:hypothetical protein
MADRANLPQSIDRQTMLMRAQIIAWVFCWLALGASGCGKRTVVQVPTPESKAASKMDACALISKEEVEAIVGSPIKETKSSERSNGVFRVAQCFYTAAEFSKSVSLSLTQSDPANKAKRTPKDFWNETFGRFEKGEEHEKEKKEKGRGEEEEGRPPTKIEGIGEEAYWASNRFGGVLYVLKNAVFMSISLGGTDSEQVKIDKSKTLAKKALERL